MHNTNEILCGWRSSNAVPMVTCVLVSRLSAIMRMGSRTYTPRQKIGRSHVNLFQVWAILCDSRPSRRVLEDPKCETMSDYLARVLRTRIMPIKTSAALPPNCPLYRTKRKQPTAGSCPGHYGVSSRFDSPASSRAETMFCAHKFVLCRGKVCAYDARGKRCPIVIPPAPGLGSNSHVLRCANAGPSRDWSRRRGRGANVVLQKSGEDARNVRTVDGLAGSRRIALGWARLSLKTCPSIRSSRQCRRQGFGFPLHRIWPPARRQFAIRARRPPPG